MGIFRNVNRTFFKNLNVKKKRKKYNAKHRLTSIRYRNSNNRVKQLFTLLLSVFFLFNRLATFSRHERAWIKLFLTMRIHSRLSAFEYNVVKRLDHFQSFSPWPGRNGRQQISPRNMNILMLLIYLPLSIFICAECNILDAKVFIVCCQ